MLAAKSIKYSYNSNNKFEFPDFCLESTEDLLIIGDSGVGKTTFLNILGGLLSPQSGSITLNGTNYSDLSNKDLDKFRGKNIGIIFQSPYFVNNLNLMDNLLFSLFLSQNQQDKNVVIELLNQVGLNDKIYSKPNDLSQGEKQRASIALALVKKPNLILADEPTSSLDDNNCDLVVSLLKEQSQLNKCKLIIITHDARLKKHFKNSIKL
ncbi:MAG: ABC transporter ATP-binding protein [Flavobacteriales bacterium]|nr:ABC transporter ATP-binding protein [Flavobacteriales bacterium]|tara:strand:+ start:5544 stop:6170 length:627 start_codon:yes stop_codon:yes gene_type:complete